MDNVRTRVLAAAMDLVNGQRESDYGTPQESFTRIADMWTAYLGYKVTGRDVCIMMGLLKAGRLSNGHHQDSAIDASAYFALSAEVAE